MSKILKPHHENIELISHEDAFVIIHEKFGIYPTEFNYCLRNYIKEYQVLFVSDLPNQDRVYPAFYGTVDDKLYPFETLYIDKKWVDEFVHFPHTKFVYLTDIISNRDWETYYEGPRAVLEIIEILEETAREGLLSSYDHSTNKFVKDPHNPWVDTLEGHKWLTSYGSFYPLYEILMIERLRFGKTKEECLKELQISKL